MALVEDVCWTILKEAAGLTHKFSVIVNSRTGKEQSVTCDNSLLIRDIEKILVLKYSKQEIEDCIYFLEKRGYIQVQDMGIKRRRQYYHLTPDALAVLENGKFLDEEQEAFKEALFDVKKPGTFGMKFNAGELWRRSRKKMKDRGD